MTYHALSAGCGGMGQLHWRRSFRDFHDAPPNFLPFLPMTLGWLGVAVFFALSGFCIHLSFAKSSRKDFKTFFVRRFFRIYPPFLAAVCFFAFLFPDTKLNMASQPDVAQFWSHFFMVHHIDVRLFYGINPSFWSIVIEAQLYLIYPLLLLLVRRYGWTIALLIPGLIEVALRTAVYFCCIPNLLHSSPLYYWLSWAVGAKLADDYLHGRPLFLTRCPFWIWPALTLFTNFLRPFGEFTFLCAALATTKFISYMLSRPPSVISYSVYLLNQPLLNAFAHYVQEFTAPHHWSYISLLCCLLGFCVAILVFSALFYRCLEVPSIELGKWVLKKIFPKNMPVEHATTPIS
ncbi:MAG: acyltransferase [Verrucomicrobia bacterium]|nr:acyltransferase [Verrucomicrobiota bacterium]